MLISRGNPTTQILVTIGHPLLVQSDHTQFYQPECKKVLPFSKRYTELLAYSNDQKLVTKLY